MEKTETKGRAEMSLYTTFYRSMIAATMFAIALPSAALAQVAQTPLQAAIQVAGDNSNSTMRSGQCGFVPEQPTQRIQVTEEFTSLRFRVNGDGAPTLLISEPGGRTQCVMSDRLSNGSLEIPGVWERGTYSLYVGDRNQGSHRFTLSISQEN